MSAIEVRSNETVLFQEGASHYHNFIAVGGVLTLTNQRLYFTSNPCLAYDHSLTIELLHVSEVNYFKTMFLNPNGLAIMTKQGDIENFIVDDRKHWSLRINEALHQPAHNL
jgi:hypothetical protein